MTGIDLFRFYGIVLFLPVGVIIFYWIIESRCKRQANKPRWEVVPAIENGEVVGYLVRWSQMDAKQRYLWVGHYYAGECASLRWCEAAAYSHCKRLNIEGRLPVDYP